MVILLIAFSSLKISAQVGSPYSQFGIGDINHSSFGASKAMGGIGIGLQTNKHINTLNPASLVSLDSLTVIYELGISGMMNKIESNIDNITKNGTSINYIALAFRLNKYVSTSFGVLPASKVDYTFLSSYSIDYVGAVNNYFYGSGGLNRIYWANSISIVKNLSVGIEASYLFGSINNIKTIIFDNISYDNFKVDEQKSIGGFKFKYGVQYKYDIKNDYDLILGATFENRVKINATIDTLAGTIDYAKSQSSSIDPTSSTYYKNFYTDEMQPNSLYSSSTNDKITLPSTIGFGLTINKKDKLTAGLDFKIQNWGSINENEYNKSFQNNISIRSGLEFIPDNNNVNHFYKRINYRIGGHYSKTHLEINSTQINDYGMSFGLGLPMRNSKTSFNISFEMGQRGTLNENLLRETYGIVSLNLSLSDIWFIKRKYK
ncbi:MAG: hypothetical protein JEZ09_11010 [Salinivirgaceae bacterium]|nr:hypothetical protein [Salinivirgaceae bacterium]